ncbi:MAG: oxysterol-binding protein [Leptolyngbyaceae cyanobacterium RM1_1_2]|nr:oxysterol-binding protein [Leptolyngbyaceae cyanobacterium RM1_1_2]
MTLDRLATVQDNLDRLYEQLAGEERASDLAEEAEKTRIQQKIRLTWQRIRERERNMQPF